MKKFTIYIAPIVLYLAGGISNKAVIAINGRMPVVVPQEWRTFAPWDLAFPGEIIDGRHAVEKESDHLKLLDDRILFGDRTYSIGDIMLVLGDDLALPVLALAALLELRRPKIAR